MKSVPLTTSSFSFSSVLSQLVHLLKFNMLPLFFFFLPDMSVHQRSSSKDTSCTDTSRSCCSYRYEVCTCMELGDWRFVREGNIMEH